MINAQFSPVAALKRVKAAVENSWKLAFLSRFSCSLISANRVTPRTEKIKRKSTIRTPRLANSGMAKMKVLKICLRLVELLMSLTILMILNDRITITTGSKFT